MFFKKLCFCMMFLLIFSCGGKKTGETDQHDFDLNDYDYIDQTDVVENKLDDDLVEDENDDFEKDEIDLSDDDNDFITDVDVGEETIFDKVAKELNLLDREEFIVRNIHHIALLKKYDGVTGDLIIKPEEFKIKDLFGLENLTFIGGSLIISRIGSKLTSLRGLLNLKYIRNDINITSAQHLPSCYPHYLEENVLYGGKSYIIYNGGDTDIYKCDFCVRNEVEEDIYFSGDVNELENITHIDGDMIISETDIEKISFPACLKEVSGNLIIENNDALLDLTEVLLPSGVKGDVIIRNNNLLAPCEIENMQRNLIFDGELIVEKNNGTCRDACNYALYEGSVNNFDFEDGTIQNYSVIHGNVYNGSGLDFGCIKYIKGNASINLRDLEHIRNLKKIDGNLRISGCIGADVFRNPEIAEEIDLNVTGDVTISTHSCTTLKGLSFLKQINGNLMIERNKQITTLKGLDAIETVSGHLTISDNPVLESIEALSSVKEIEQELWVMDNPALVSFKGLKNLQTVRGSWQIYNNSSLINLEMPKLQEVIEGINIKHNQSLPVAEINKVSRKVRTLRESYFYNNKPFPVQERPEIITDILIVVSSDLFNVLSNEIEQYQQDLKNEGMESAVVTFDSGTVDDLKAVLQNYYEENGIRGAFLIGDLPYLTYELIESTIAKMYTGYRPSDIYLMDLDNVWLDTSGSGVINYHDINDLEIFVGRLMGTVTEMKSYFAKNHTYRTEGRLLDRSAFIIADDSLVLSNEAGTPRYVDHIYDSDDITIYDTHETSTRDHYLSFLENEGAELVFQIAHAGPEGIGLSPAEGPEYILESIDIDDVKKSSIKASFFVLDNCMASDFSLDNIANAYVHTQFGLVTIGSATTWSGVRDNLFFPALGEGKIWGEALMETYDPNNMNDAFTIGLNIQGDPTLRLYK